MVAKGWWSEPEETTLLSKNKQDVLAAFKRAEKLPKPKLGEMFNDVWNTRRGEQVPRVIVSALSFPLNSVNCGQMVRLEHC